MRRASPSSSFMRQRDGTASRPAPVLAPSPRVLVVDDDAGLRDLLVQSLAEEGYQASAACDGQVALREVLLHWPDLVLLDLEMPVLNGWEFLRVRSEHPRLATIPVVVLSADDAPPSATAAFRKPFLVEEVLDAVRRIAGPGIPRPSLSIVRGGEGPLESPDR
jgi:CheY-like chemotaxis protein